MGVDNFLYYFLEFTKSENNIFRFVSLGSLEKDSLEIKKLSLEVIDFNNVKNLLFNAPQPKSADGLKILTKNNYILLIELKGLLKFESNIKSFNDLRKKIEINKQVAKFDLNKKILDSVNVLKRIIELPNFNTKIKEKFDLVPIQFILVTDVGPNNPVEKINLSLQNLGSISIYGKLSNDLSQITNILNIQRPRLLHCTEFQNEFSKIE
jgi:hypothetical protein